MKTRLRLRAPSVLAARSARKLRFHLTLAALAALTLAVTMFGHLAAARAQGREIASPMQVAAGVGRMGIEDRADKAEVGTPRTATGATVTTGASNGSSPATSDVISRCECRMSRSSGGSLGAMLIGAAAIAALLRKRCGSSVPRQRRKRAASLRWRSNRIPAPYLLCPSRFAGKRSQVRVGYGI